MENDRRFQIKLTSMAWRSHMLDIESKDSRKQCTLLSPSLKWRYIKEFDVSVAVRFFSDTQYITRNVPLDRVAAGISRPFTQMLVSASANQKRCTRSRPAPPGTGFPLRKSEKFQYFYTRPVHRIRKKIIARVIQMFY
jgi:hypothetical protein